MDTDTASLAMPGQAFAFERCQPDAGTEGCEESPATDYLIHSWEAPTYTSACCGGKFASAEPSCAFAQQGGVAFLDAGTTGTCSAHDMHCYDRVDTVMCVRVPGAHPLNRYARCFPCALAEESCHAAGLSRDMLFVRTRDLTFTILASIKSSQLEELHHSQLAPEAVAAGTGTRAAVLSQPIIALTECHEGSHHSVVYVALATAVSIFILDMRIEVSLSAQSVPG